MWESRHGFPTPNRLPGGHRRYSDRDVDRVREVGRLREQGLSMAAAVARVTSSRPAPSSIFAGLAEAYPQLQPTVMSKRALVSVTRAIEDEYCARAGGGLLIGSFQREQFYRQIQRRWDEIARCAEVAVAVADFSRLHEPEATAAEIPIGPDQPLGREWTLIAEAPDFRACLAAWEPARSASVADWTRRFEVLWSFETPAVRAASHIAVTVLDDVAADVGRRARRALPGAEPAAARGVGSSLSQRIVGYLAAMVDRPHVAAP